MTDNSYSAANDFIKYPVRTRYTKEQMKQGIGHISLRDDEIVLVRPFLNSTPDSVRVCRFGELANGAILLGRGLSSTRLPKGRADVKYRYNFAESLNPS